MYGAVLCGAVLYGAVLCGADAIHVVCYRGTDEQHSTMLRLQSCYCPQLSSFSAEARAVCSSASLSYECGPGSAAREPLAAQPAAPPQPAIEEPYLCTSSVSILWLSF